MAQPDFALAVGGLNPADPDRAPGSDLSLTARQRRELEAALRQAPRPADILRLVRDGLQRGRPLLMILEDARAAGGLPALRQYAGLPAPAPAASVEAPAPAPRRPEDDAARPAPAPAPRG